MQTQTGKCVDCNRILNNKNTHRCWSCHVQHLPKKPHAKRGDNLRERRIQVKKKKIVVPTESKAAK